MTTKIKNKSVKMNELKILTFDLGETAKTFHNLLISMIVAAIKKELNAKVNYDHVPEFYEKSKDVPLNIGGRKWDIVVEIGKKTGRYAAIEIKTLKEVKEEEAEAWQS